MKKQARTGGFSRQSWHDFPAKASSPPVVVLEYGIYSVSGGIIQQQRNKFRT
jgi:hypothetical protein